MSNVFHRWEDVKTLQSGKMVTPHFAILQTSDICNQHCHGCAYGNLTGKFMSVERHVTAIDILTQFGVRAFDLCGGGEPLAMPGAAEIIRHCGKRGANVGLVTNGTLIKDDSLDAMAHFGTYIRVSVESANADEYAKYKGVPPDVFNKVVQNVSTALSYMRSVGSKCDVGVKFGVGKSLRGQQHYEQGIELGQKLGASRITFKALRHEPEELTLDEKHYENFLLSRAIESSGAKNVKVWIVPIDSDSVPQCYLSPMHVVLDWQGNVYICCYYYFRQESHRLFNIFDDDFEDKWFDPSHWEKIHAIDRSECSKVDCKFFTHHGDIEAAGNGGIYFL